MGEEIAAQTSKQPSQVVKVNKWQSLDFKLFVFDVLSTRTCGRTRACTQTHTDTAIFFFFLADTI